VESEEKLDLKTEIMSLTWKVWLSLTKPQTF